MVIDEFHHKFIFTEVKRTKTQGKTEEDPDDKRTSLIEKRMMAFKDDKQKEEIKKI